MAGPIYIANFDFRGRCPENENDKIGEYAVRLGQFQEKPGGGLWPVESDTLTPARAEKAGWTLDAILGAIAAQAVRDMETAKADAELSRMRMEEMQEARSVALADKIAAEKAKTEAEAAQRAAESAAIAARAERDEIAAAAINTVNALRAELAAAKADKAALLQAAVDAAEPAV